MLAGAISHSSIENPEQGTVVTGTASGAGLDLAERSHAHSLSDAKGWAVRLQPGRVLLAFCLERSRLQRTAGGCSREPKSSTSRTSGRYRHTLSRGRLALARLVPSQCIGRAFRITTPAAIDVRFVSIDRRMRYMFLDWSNSHHYCWA